MLYAVMLAPPLAIVGIWVILAWRLRRVLALRHPATHAECGGALPMLATGVRAAWRPGFGLLRFIFSHAPARLGDRTLLFHVWVMRIWFGLGVGAFLIFALLMLVPVYC